MGDPREGIPFPDSRKYFSARFQAPQQDHFPCLLTHHFTQGLYDQNQILNGFVLALEDETPPTVAQFRNSDSDVDMQEPVTDRVLALSNEQIFFEEHLEVRKYDWVLYSPTNVIQVEVSNHQHIYRFPFANLLADFTPHTNVPQED